MVLHLGGARVSRDDDQIARGRRQRQPRGSLGGHSGQRLLSLLDLGRASRRRTPDSGDAHSVELGVKFTSEVFGTVTGVRFYKSAANTGTHIGSLWSASGQLLATATFTGETASGWQQVNFSTPVDDLPEHHLRGFATSPRPVTTPLRRTTSTRPPADGRQYPEQPAPARGFGERRTRGGDFGSANGVYAYSSTSTSSPPAATTRPTTGSTAVFEPATAPGQVTNVSATAGPGSASLTWSAPSSGGRRHQVHDHPVP